MHISRGKIAETWGQRNRARPARMSRAPPGKVVCKKRPTSMLFSSSARTVVANVMLSFQIMSASSAIRAAAVLTTRPPILRRRYARSGTFTNGDTNVTRNHGTRTITCGSAMTVCVSLFERKSRSQITYWTREITAEGAPSRLEIRSRAALQELWKRHPKAPKVAAAWYQRAEDQSELRQKHLTHQGKCGPLSQHKDPGQALCYSSSFLTRRLLGPCMGVKTLRSTWALESHFQLA